MAEKKKTRTVIVVNKIRCKKCEDIIQSRHVHDFVSCKCGAVFADGGRDYLRRGGEPVDYEDLSVSKEVPLTPSEIAEQERFDKQVEEIKKDPYFHEVSSEFNKIFEEKKKP